MSASQLTRMAYEAHRRGEAAFWLTCRATYQGFREAGDSPLCAFWRTVPYAMRFSI